LPADDHWLEQEQEEYARLRASRDQHLVDGEQPSQAQNLAKELPEERLAIKWHLLPTPFLFELADVPFEFLGGRKQRQNHRPGGAEPQEEVAPTAAQP
jgi:hypothetical protein